MSSTGISLFNRVTKSNFTFLTAFFLIKCRIPRNLCILEKRYESKVVDKQIFHFYGKTMQKSKIQKITFCKILPTNLVLHFFIQNLCQKLCIYVYGVPRWTAANDISKTLEKFGSKLRLMGAIRAKYVGTYGNTVRLRCQFVYFKWNTSYSISFISRYSRENPTDFFK